MKNKIIIMSFTIIVAVFISVLMTNIFNVSIFLIIGICYSILCFLLIPSEDFIATSSNYETKKSIYISNDFIVCRLGSTSFVFTPKELEEILFCSILDM